MNFKTIVLSLTLFAGLCHAEFITKPYNRATDEQVLKTCIVSVYRGIKYKFSPDPDIEDVPKIVEVMRSPNEFEQNNIATFCLFDDQQIIGCLILFKRGDNEMLDLDNDMLSLTIIVDHNYSSNKILAQKTFSTIIEFAQLHNKSKLVSMDCYGISFEPIIFKQHGFDKQELKYLNIYLFDMNAK